MIFQLNMFFVYSYIGGDTINESLQQFLDTGVRGLYFWLLYTLTAFKFVYYLRLLLLENINFLV